MSQKLLHNLRVMNPYGDPEYLENAYILIEDGTISSISDVLTADDFSGETIDMGGKTVLPGMINAHTHLYSTLALGMPPPKNTPTNFVEILKEIWWKLDLGLDRESTKASFETGLLDALRNGVTTVIDHHASPNFVNGSLELLANTADKLGINICLCFESSDRNGLDNFQEELQENLNAIAKYTDHPHIEALLGLHASFTLSDESLQKVSDALKEFPETGIHIHVAEDLADEKDAQRKGYASVIQRLDHFGLLTNRALIIHGVFITREDRHTLLKSGCRLIHNPTSNAGNQVGILETEIIESLHAGLGTDGKQNNMLSEVREGALIRSAASDHQVDYLKLLFDHNPEIVNRFFKPTLGHLSPGNQADLVFYDYLPRTEINRDNFIKHLLYGLGKPCDVMTRGEFRLKDNVILNIDEKEVLRQAQVQSRRVWDAMEKI